MAAVIVLFASFFYMTAVFKGIGNLLEVFLDIPYRAAIIIVFFIVMLYTVVGGFISVVKTDAVQGIVMVVAAILLFRGVVSAAGGLDSAGLLAGNPATEPLLRWGGGVSVPLALGVVFAGTVKFAVEPRQLSRFYALESRAAIRRGVWVSTFAFVLVYSLLIPVGLYARNIMPGGLADTDMVVPQLLTTPGVFSAGVSAFLLLAMVAAAMSSLDSVLLVMASTAQRDIVGMFRTGTSERSMLTATRLYVALFALITAIISLSPPEGIVVLTALSGAIYGACFGPALLMGLHWRRGNGNATIASFATGLLVLLVWNRLPWGDAMHQVFPPWLSPSPPTVWWPGSLRATSPRSWTGCSGRSGAEANRGRRYRFCLYTTRISVAPSPSFPTATETWLPVSGSSSATSQPAYTSSSLPPIRLAEDATSTLPPLLSSCSYQRRTSSGSPSDASRTPPATAPPLE